MSGQQQTQAFFEDLAKKSITSTKGLDQSEASIKRRHEAICGNLPMHAGLTVLDLGCGNGDLMRAMLKADRKVALYHGVDIVDREGVVQLTAKELGLYADFAQTSASESYPFQSIFHEPRTYDVAICTGVVGYEGLSSLKGVDGLYRRMKVKARHGAITLPAQLPHDKGCAQIARFAKEDMVDRWGALRLVDLGPEMMLWW